MPSPGTENLIFERHGATAVVTMNRPEAKNALSLPMLVGMADAWEEIDGNDEIRCAVLTGAGGTFCSGMDLKSMAAPEAEAVPAPPGGRSRPALEGPAPSLPTAQAAHRRRRGLGGGGRNRDPPGHRHPGGGRERQVRGLRGPPGAVPPGRLDRPAPAADPLHRRHGPPAHGPRGQRRRRPRRSGSSVGSSPTARPSTRPCASPRSSAATARWRSRPSSGRCARPRGSPRSRRSRSSSRSAGPSSPPRMPKRARRRSPRSARPSTSGADARTGAGCLGLRHLRRRRGPRTPVDAAPRRGKTPASSWPTKCAGSRAPWWDCPSPTPTSPPPRRRSRSVADDLERAAGPGRRSRAQPDPVGAPPGVLPDQPRDRLRQSGGAARGRRGRRRRAAGHRHLRLPVRGPARRASTAASSPWSSTRCWAPPTSWRGARA